MMNLYSTRSCLALLAFASIGLYVNIRPAVAEQIKLSAALAKICSPCRKPRSCLPTVRTLSVFGKDYFGAEIRSAKPTKNKSIEKVAWRPSIRYNDTAGS